jgi:hypothetical protein
MVSTVVKYFLHSLGSSDSRQVKTLNNSSPPPSSSKRPLLTSLWGFKYRGVQKNHFQCHSFNPNHHVHHLWPVLGTLLSVWHLFLSPANLLHDVHRHHVSPAQKSAVVPQTRSNSNTTALSLRSNTCSTPVYFKPAAGPCFSHTSPFSSWVCFIIPGAYVPRVYVG